MNCTSTPRGCMKLIALHVDTCMSTSTSDADQVSERAESSRLVKSTFQTRITQMSVALHVNMRVPEGHRLANSTETEDSRDAMDMFSAIEQLQNISQTPPKRRRTNASALTQSIASKAYASGIPLEELIVLVDVLTRPNHLDQGSITTVIKNLYPLSKVPSSVIANIVCCLGPGKTKPTPATQALLLQWLLLVYEVLEDPSYLGRFYRTLFNYLDMLSLSRPLCHLLCVITRRKHVKPHRIQALLELQQSLGNEPSLESLTRIYKDYYPDIVVTDVRAKRRNHFMNHDIGWTERLWTIQAAGKAQEPRSMNDPHSQSSFKVVRRGVKRSRVSIIPEVRTYGASEGSTMLEEIENVEDFVGHLENIDLPNQLISTIQDPLAMKLLKIGPDKDAERRLEQWLDAFFKDVARDEEYGDENQVALDHVLNRLLAYVRYTKVMPPPLEMFLERLMQSSNGRSTKTILELLSYLPIRRSNILHGNFLAALHVKAVDNTPGSKSGLLDFYGSLLVQWTNSILSSPSPTPLGAVEIQECILQVIERASTLSLTMLETWRRDSEDVVISFFVRLAYIFSYASTAPPIRISLPPQHVVCLLAFANNSSTLSRVCAVLATYKEAYEASMTISKVQGMEIAMYPMADVNTFNGCVMDVCNLLWRNRALNRHDLNATGCLVPPQIHTPLQDYLDALGGNLSLASLFSLSYHGGFSAASAAGVREAENAEHLRKVGGLNTRLAGPANQRSLGLLEKQGGLALSWQRYRLEMLQWLDERGSEGVGKLMRNTMKILRQNGS